MKKVKLFEEFTANHVECDNCGWTWMLQDGGDDLYICHECGHDNTPVLGESLNEENYQSPYIKNEKVTGKVYHVAGEPIKSLNNRPMWFALEKEHSDDGWYANMLEYGAAYQYSAKASGKYCDVFEDRIQKLFKDNGLNTEEWETEIVSNPSAEEVMKLEGTKLLIKNGFDGAIYVDYDPRDSQSDLDALIVFNASKNVKGWKLVKSED